MTDRSVVGESNSVVVFADDLEASTAFFETYFAFEVSPVRPLMGGYMLRNAYGLMILLPQDVARSYEDTARVGWGLQPMFVVDDVRALHQRMLDDLVPLESPVIDIGYGEVFVVRTPDGYPVCAATVHRS